MAIQGSRLLNDNGPVLGLNVYDLAGGVAILIVTSELLKPLGLDVLAIPAAVASVASLIPVRMRYRRKIIRDTLQNFLMERTLYVPHV